MDQAIALGIEAVERGLVPDALTRLAIRRLCRNRLRDLQRPGAERWQELFVDSLRQGQLALHTQAANEQHYELPAEFFATVLGPRRKYSCCYWPTGVSTLAEAEIAALGQTCEYAQLQDGQEVLELGCGWGSLSLWMAEHYPNSRITAMSNSSSQRAFVEHEAAARGLLNLRVVTADVNDFDPMAAGSFDRVVSVEMFEHLRNYELLFERIARWLNSAGKLYVHVFCHRRLAYPFEAAGQADWMARYFFTGGIMPSADLFSRFDRHLRVTDQWTWSGDHYQRTALAWLENLDANRARILDTLHSVFGERAPRWFQRWRMFFLAVAELFGYHGGQEWFVKHSLLEHQAR